MKTRFRKRLVLVLVSIIIIALFTGCGSSPSVKPSSETENSSTSETVKSPVTLTISKPFTNTGIQTDPVAKALEEATGISIDSVFNASTMGDDYIAKILAMAASGDLPDIIFFDGSNAASIKTRDQLINAGAIIELSDLVKSNGPNLLANPLINANIEYRKAFYNTDGKSLWVIPCVSGPQSKFGQPVVAVNTVWEYYKELGYPKVDTSDDLLNVFAQMQKNHPKDINGKNAYGVSFHTDWGMEPIWENMMFDGYYPTQMLSVDISNNSVTEMFTDKKGQFWKWMNWYYKANQMGILDPDSYTMKYDQLLQKIAAQSTYFFTLWAANEGYAPIDYAPGKNMDANFGVTGGQYLYAITSNCKTPDRAIDMFNWFASDDGMTMAYNGVKGLAWDIVDGVPQLTQALSDELKKTGTEKRSEELFGYMKWACYSSLGPNEMNTTLNTPYAMAGSISEIKKTMSKSSLEMAKYYGKETVGQVFQERKYNSFTNPVGAVIPQPTGAIKENLDKINAYMAANWLKPIAAKDDADFSTQQDKIISDINAMGYQEVAKWYIETWNTFKTQVEATGIK